MWKRLLVGLLMIGLGLGAARAQSVDSIAGKVVGFPGRLLARIQRKAAGRFMTSTVADVGAYPWYAGGRWRDGCSATRFHNFEPYTGSLCSGVADCGPEDARLGISGARGRFRLWAEMTSPIT